MTTEYEVPEEIRRRLIACFPGTAGKKFSIYETMHEQQIAWPVECSHSETEIRDELKALVDGFKALRDRARVLFAGLPEPPDAEFESEVPPSVYFTLVDAVALAEENTSDILEFLDKRVTATAESLRNEWLITLLERTGEWPNGKKVSEAIEKLARVVRKTDDPLCQGSCRPARGPTRHALFSRALLRPRRPHQSWRELGWPGQGREAARLRANP